MDYWRTLAVSRFFCFPRVTHSMPGVHNAFELEGRPVCFAPEKSANLKKHSDSGVAHSLLYGTTPAACCRPGSECHTRTEPAPQLVELAELLTRECRGEG